jgi:hypothetical protein
VTSKKFLPYFELFVGSMLMVLSYVLCGFSQLWFALEGVEAETLSWNSDKRLLSK